ncbi:MAG: ribosome-associated translation inhibitor RaiA [Candidatus Sungiibacteriota bacterium]
MRFTITARHIKLTPSIGTYARDKLAKLFGKLFRDPAFSQAITVDLEFTLVTRHHQKGKIWKADAALTLPREKQPLYAEVTDEDIHAAIDFLAEELEHQLQTYKGKSQALMRRGARVAKKELRLDPAARLPRRGRVRNEGN